MFLTEEQARARLSSEKNLANASFLRSDEKTEVKLTEKVIQLPGRDRDAMTKETRTEIAIRARAGERQIDLAKEFDTYQPHISNIKNGKIKGVDEAKVKEITDQVKDRALDRLMHSLGLLDNDKLAKCSAKDLSVIASNMGRVVEKITPHEEKVDNINFIIYTPEMRQEKNYDVIEVG